PEQEDGKENTSAPGCPMVTCHGFLFSTQPTPDAGRRDSRSAQAEPSGKAVNLKSGYGGHCTHVHCGQAYFSASDSRAFYILLVTGLQFRQVAPSPTLRTLKEKKE